MLNLINVLNGVQADTLCEELEPVLRIVGIAIFIIKVVVPISWISPLESEGFKILAAFIECSASPAPIIL